MTDLLLVGEHSGNADGETAAEFCEEVAVEYDGDALEEGGVDGMFLKKTVDIRAVAAELTRKPGYAALLPLKLLFDNGADGFHVYIIKVVSGGKRTWT